MIEFLQANYFIFFYLIIFLVSMFTYQKYFDTVLKLFPIYLAYTIFTELLGYFILTFEDFSFFEEQQYSWHNVILFNIYALVVFYYFTYIYYKLLRVPKHKTIIVVIGVLILLCYIINIILENPFHSGLYQADALASASYIIMVVLYLKEGKWKVESGNLMFWVSLGLLVFHAVYPFLNIIGFTRPEVWIAYHFRELLKVLIIISYSLYLIGLIRSQRSAFR